MGANNAGHQLRNSDWANQDEKAQTQQNAGMMKVKSQLGRYPKNMEPSAHLQQPCQAPQQLLQTNASGANSALDSHMAPLEQVSNINELLLR